MGNIADKLQSILQAKEDIKNALQNKGVIISSSDPFRSYAGKISNISQFEQENAVRFFDYNGDVLYRYTFDEISALTELPALPVHTGLICQGWNWTLDNIKQVVTEYGKCDVGTIYITDDGKTRLYINLISRARKIVPLYFYQTVTNGVTIDWGDGIVETVSGTGMVNPRHDYATVGEYIITLDVAEGCEIQLGNGNENYNIMGYDNNKAYSNMLTKVEIGSRVVGLKPYCFYYGANISTITIPNSLVTVSSYALAYCRSLKHLNIPLNITSLGSNSLISCVNLNTISLPNSIVSLGTNVFQHCNTLSSIIIPNVTSIPKYAFGSCDNLAQIILGKNVTTIGEYAFEYTRCLHELNLYDKVNTIGQYAFRGSAIKSLTVPEGVTTINQYTFNVASSLTKIILPSSLTKISTYAFGGCNALLEIIIPNSVTTIDTYAFNECESLTRVVLPNTLTTISNYVFYKCISLIDIEIPDSVTSIGSHAFYNCTSLKQLNIPDSVTSIGSYALSYCQRVPEFTLPVLETISAELFNYSNGAGIIDLSKFGQIPSYGSNSFANLASDCKILVPNHLINDWKTTTGWTTVAPKITEGFNISNISSYNTNVNNVQLGNTSYTNGDFSCNTSGVNYFGEAEIRKYTFEIKDLYVGTNKSAETVSKNISFEYAGESFPITVTQGPYVENVIVCTYNVTSTTNKTTLLYSSFSNYSTYFSSMIIDGEEMPIATSYKFNTTGEHSVLFKIAEGVDITNLYRMFYACSALKTVDLSELDMSLVTSNSNSAGTAYMFYNCTGLKSIVLPESTKYLGYYMFYGCYNVERFIIKSKIAPTLYGYATFGYSNYYIGYNTRTYGTNKFQIPIEATGYDTTTWTNYLFSSSYCGFKKLSPYIKQECTNLEITANDVSWASTTTLINWTAVVNCLDETTEEIVELTFTGTEVSDSFSQNMSETETVEREISFTYMGVNATTTIAQGVYIRPIYTVDLNNQWRLSTSVVNPDSSLYDGVYESNSNYHVANGIAKMYIDIVGYAEFKFYIRSDGEPGYDYVRVGNLDQDPATSAYVTTSDKQNSGTAINNYTLVTFRNIDGGSHRIIIDYRKDTSKDSGTDRGYVLIPIEQ